MAVKVTPRAEFLEVEYDQAQWNLLKRLRDRAAELMGALEQANINSLTYGSIARGDVKLTSDIDVFAYSGPNSLQVELALERAGIPAERRFLIQATPSYTPKAFWEIEPYLSVSAPLMKMRRNEREFYTFAGEIERRGLLDGRRVPGVDKRLMLIEPTERGHRESSVKGRQSHAAKTLGVNPRMVEERVRVLSKRDKVGRTGLFVERQLGPEEAFESVLVELSARNPALRRRIRESQR
jgi:predicted nucleotidyltransferase